MGSGDSALPPFVFALAHDYTLTAPYPGLDLSAQPWFIPEMGLDRRGNQRVSWDMGAYESLSGDVSGDGRISMYDAALVLRYTVGGSLTPVQQVQADVNGDTTIDATDAVAIARKALWLN